MRFVIVGAGRVGMRTARVLREEGHEVVLVERDRTKVERLEEEGFDVVHGDGSDEETLLELGLEEADGLAGLSGDLTVNYIACLIAKAHGCRTVLRVDSDDREGILRKYADDVDEVIYPERLGAILAKNALLGGSIRAIADIALDVQVVELTVGENSPMRGYTLAELELPADVRLLAFRKADGAYSLPSPDESLEAGDAVAVCATFEALADARRIVVGEAEAVPAGGG